MAKSGRTNRLPPFVAMPWCVLNSQAYKALNHSSRACLPYWFGKPKEQYGTLGYYSTEFAFSYQEANSYGFSSATFFKVIRETMSKGFIDPKDKGGLRGDGLSCSSFCLSKRWEKYGTTEFVEVRWEGFEPRKRKSPLQKRKRTALETEIKLVKKAV